MLETMRNQAQSWIAKVILGGVVLSFALWGIGDYFLGSHIEPVAEVDDTPITQTEFAQAYERQMNNYRRMLGSRFSKEFVESLGLKNATLQTMINRRLMVEQARKLGLVVPSAMIVANVQQEKAFQSAGRFDPQRYRILTRNMGFATPQDYEQELGRDLLIDMLQKTITDSARVSDAEVHDRFMHDYEKRVFAALIIDPKDLEKDVKVGPEQAKAWYEAHKQGYLSPLRVKLRVVDIDPVELAKDLTISKSDLDKAYEENIARYTKPEQRHARHILVKVDQQASEGARKAAREKIEAALKRIRSGEDFAKVAKEVSEDTTAAKGGDLGWFSRGAMVAPFEEAVFSMNPGEVSDIVETPFGFHIIKLEGIRPEQVLPLEKVRPELEAEIRRSMGADEAYNLSQDLDDALGREGSLEAAAKAVGLSVREIGPISATEALADPVLADASVRQRAFTMQPGDPVEIEETQQGHFVALELVERLEPKPLPFAKVTEQALADARRAAAKKKAEKLAAEVLKAAADGKDAEALAQRFSLPKFISKPVRFNGDGDKAGWLTRAILDNGFELPKGAWLKDVQQTPEGLTLVQVQDILAAPEDEFADKKEQIREQVRRAKGAVRFDRWMSALREEHEVHIHEDVLSRF